MSYFCWEFVEMLRCGHPPLVSGVLRNAGFLETLLGLRRTMLMSVFRFEIA